jgi:hypothetical protein
VAVYNPGSLDYTSSAGNKYYSGNSNISAYRSTILDLYKSKSSELIYMPHYSDTLAFPTKYAQYYRNKGVTDIQAYFIENNSNDWGILAMTTSNAQNFIAENAYYRASLYGYGSNYRRATGLESLTFYGQGYNNLTGSAKSQYETEYITAAKELGYLSAFIDLSIQAASFVINMEESERAKQVQAYVGEVQGALRSAQSTVENYMYQKREYTAIQTQAEAKYQQALADQQYAQQQTAMYQQQAAEIVRQIEQTKATQALTEAETAKINDEILKTNQQIEATQQEIVQYEAEYNKYVKELEELERLEVMPTTSWRTGSSNTERRGSSFGGTSITGVGGVTGSVPTRSKGLLGA